MVERQEDEELVQLQEQEQLKSLLLTGLVDKEWFVRQVVWTQCIFNTGQSIVESRPQRVRQRSRGTSYGYM